MGISRLKWSGAFLMAGLVCLGAALRQPPANVSRYEYEGESAGKGLAAAIFLVGSAAFAIQHWRHRHDYDGEDHYE